MQWLPFTSSLVSLIFAVVVFDQYLARRKPHQLVWSIGFFFYFASTLAEFLWEAYGANELVYRLWYLTGAIYVAAYLGMGTVYLLASRRKAHITMTVLGLASVYALVKVAAAPVDVATLTQLAGTAFPADVRLITPFFNIFGTVALVGGAIYSAAVFWRKRIMPHRVLSNFLIALGAIMPAFGGTLLRFGVPQPFYFLELAGIIIIFLGFLRNREVFGLFRVPLVHLLVPASRSKSAH
ncbi:MAG: hypothetical protein HYX96_08055 [Chloroflexi bacterium]|nr:hypothetical protein [Chloroflexota bacterium]